MEAHAPAPRPPSPPLLEKNNLKDFIAGITPRPKSDTISTSCRPSAQIAAAHAHEHLHHNPNTSARGNRARSTSWDSFNLYSPSSGSPRHSRINSWASSASASSSGAAGQGMRPVGLLDLPQWGSPRTSWSSSADGNRSRQSSQTSYNFSHGHAPILEHGENKTFHQDNIIHSAAILPDSPASVLVDLPEEVEPQSPDPTIHTTLMPPQFILDQLLNNEHVRLWCLTPAGIRIGHASQQDPYSSFNELYDRNEDAHKLLGGPPRQDDQLSFHETWSASRTFLASLRHLAAIQARNRNSGSTTDKSSAPSFEEQARAWSIQFDLIFSHPYIHVPRMWPVLAGYICRLRRRSYDHDALPPSTATLRSGSPKRVHPHLDKMDRLDPVLLNESRKQFEMDQGIESLVV
ncbi:hypothetical protein OC845_004821 [Tilletia horrida]|nr:hypothetical protein OC845_004821 [Tilletia horrida]